MLPPTLYLIGGAVVVTGIVSGIAGYKVAKNACDADKARVLEAAFRERKVDEAFTTGVSTAYEGVAAQLRRITTVNRVELTREIQKVEYRCPVPDDAVRLLNAAIGAANAAAGQPDPAVRPDPTPDGEGSGGTGYGILGAYDKLR